MDSVNFNTFQSDGTERAAQIKPMRYTTDSKTVPQQNQDTVSISPKALKVIDNISRLQNMPEVRPEKIDEFKGQVRDGIYPSPTIVDGFNRLIGNLQGNLAAAV